MIKLISIVGARPQFVKLAPLIRVIEERSNDIEHIIVHTGQHYHTGLSDVFFEELQIPQPNYNLEVGSGLHGYQTSQMLEKIEQVLLQTMPDMVLIFGDTNSTLAGALAANKLHMPTAHLEAGLRSYNRNMPEETNRIVADHISDLLLVPTATAMQNLRKEGLSSRAILTGDIMYEAVLLSRKIAKEGSCVLEGLQLNSGEYGLVTLHRAENTDNPRKLRNIMDVLNIIAEKQHLVFPLHPRTAKHLSEISSTWAAHSKLQLVDPLSYFDMLQLIDNASVILTDSGGLQKEAFFIGCPCVTLREETEWVETVEGGGNVLVGADPEKILSSVAMWKEFYPQGKADFSMSADRFFGNPANESISMATLEALFAFSQNINKPL